MRITKTKYYRRGKYTAQFIAGFLAGLLEAVFTVFKAIFSYLRKLKFHRLTCKSEKITVEKEIGPKLDSVEMAEKAMVKLGFRQAEARRRVGLVVSRPDAPKDASSLLAAAMTASESREGA